MIAARERCGGPRLLGLLVLLLLSRPALAGFREDFIDPQDGMFDASKYLSTHLLGFLPVPVIITEPAVGNGFGLMGIFFHESEEQKQERSEGGFSGRPMIPANVSLAGGFATENGSWGAGLGHLGFWKQDRVRYRGFAGFPSLNLDYYSLGGVELPRPVELNVEGPAIFNELKTRLRERSGWFVGARQIFRRVDISLAEQGDLNRLPEDVQARIDAFVDARLNRTTDTSGIGLLAEYDTRNNPFNPETGYDYSASYEWFDHDIGSDVDYTATNVTALNYWTLADRYLIGLRLQYDGIDADDDTRLPPYVPPSVVLRGISRTRYQGNDVLVGEVQLDYRLTPRWKVGAFLGAGRAAASFGDLDDSGSAVSRGVGFRYLIARRYGFAMGLDVAKGPEESAFYIQAGANW